MLTKAYRSLVPEDVRYSIRRLQDPEDVGRFDILRHELVWHLSDEERLAHRRCRKLLGDRGYWCFILGVNNSGTTLLHKILADHEDARALPMEGQSLTRALRRPWDHAAARLWATQVDLFHMTEEDGPGPAWRAIHDWAFHYRGQPGHVLLEKSPPNTIRSRWLARWFQPSRFITLVRNPYAVCEGIRRRNEHPISDAARHWAVANDTLYEDLSHLPADQPVLRITYERLSEHHASVLDEICRFLEIPNSFGDDLGPLDVHNIESRPSEIRNFNDDSIARLSAEDIRIVTEIAGETMVRLGYEPF
ncbi:MAG: sulfotransferase [Gemmatimonadota bacterium]|nr:sulfotransferase [Gemmatimonadota bacterium]